MATLRKMRGKYYARVRTWNGYKQKEHSISLNTTDKTDAYTRLDDINLLEDEIHNGKIQQFQFKGLFKWQNSSGTSTLIKLTIQDVVGNYLAYRKNKVRLSTVNRDRISINQFIKYFDKPKPIDELSYKDIESGFIPYLRENGYKDTGINITLRHLRIFFNWMYRREKIISEPIRFDMCKIGEQLYCYFNESELKLIYESDKVSDFYKRCFFFYEQTGVRPIEPMIGEIHGDWLIIDASKSKGKNVRQIQLSAELKQILKEIQSFRDSYIEMKSTDPNDRAYRRISMALMEVVRSLNFKGKNLTLKSMRHTYGIRRITETGDIFQVAREMGHKDVTTTQLYLQFPEQRRLDDFPSLRKYIENNMVVNGSNFSHMPTSARQYANPPIQGSS